MHWEFINASVAILTLLFTVFLEWDRIVRKISPGSRPAAPSKPETSVVNPSEKPSDPLPNQNLANPSWSFLTIWVACAFVCAFVLGIWQELSVHQTETLIVIPSAFAALGLCQWLLLRKRLSNMNGWIIAATLPVFILVLIGGGSSVTLFMIGIAQGFSQWLLLRSQLQKAHIWWIVSAVSWPVGILLAFLIPDGMRPFFLYPLEVGVIIYELSRGALMVWLLNQHLIPLRLVPQK